MVWSRENPDVLVKPEQHSKQSSKTEQQPGDTREHHKRAHEATHAPSANAVHVEYGSGRTHVEAAPQKPPQLEPLADFLRQYPQIPSEWRTNFWEIPNMQNPETTAHEALPPTRPAEPKPVHAQKTAAMVPEQIVKLPQAEEILAAPAYDQELAAADRIEAAATEAEVANPERKPLAEATPNSAGQRLKQLNELKARRAAELSRKNGETVTNPVRLQAAAPEQMNLSIGRTELLALAEQIRVDGISVAEMFRAGRLDESGLRRVMTEYLRGRNVEKVLTSELLRNAMKFERDPKLRTAQVQRNGSGSAKRVATIAKNRAKQALNPHANRERASKLAGRLVTQFDRAVDKTEANPNSARTIAIAFGIIIYFAILILIIKS
jgi:hypothetical protein